MQLFVAWFEVLGGDFADGGAHVEGGGALADVEDDVEGVEAEDGAGVAFADAEEVDAALFCADGFFDGVFVGVLGVAQRAAVAEHAK